MEKIHFTEKKNSYNLVTEFRLVIHSYFSSFFDFGVGKPM